MSSARISIVTGLVAAVVALPIAPASAHVHGVTPLRCTPASESAGAARTDATPAAAANGGPLAATAIPVEAGGNIAIGGGGFNAAVCD
jgi:hypothetical protein